jgi:hypothetical protein
MHSLALNSSAAAHSIFREILQSGRCEHFRSSYLHPGVCFREITRKNLSHAEDRCWFRSQFWRIRALFATDYRD